MLRFIRRRGAAGGCSPTLVLSGSPNHITAGAMFVALSVGLACTATATSETERVLFITRCALCHQPEGQGLVGVAPPLRDRVRAYALQPDGWRYLARVVTFGLSGPIEDGGARYRGSMPAFSTLSSQQRADILNYVANLGAPGPLPAPLLGADVDRYTRDAADPESLRLERPRLPGPSSGPTSEIPDRGAVRPGDFSQGPRVAYARNCRGCHLPSGEGISGRVPQLRHAVGYLLRRPEGRAYVARVPGVVYSSLSNAELSSLLNWMVVEFSANELPHDWQPYTTEEVATLRARPLTDVTLERARVLKAAGDASVEPAATQATDAHVIPTAH
jgi:mono/diheme cytochrome c family protein